MLRLGADMADSVRRRSSGSGVQRRRADEGFTLLERGRRERLRGVRIGCGRVGPREDHDDHGGYNIDEGETRERYGASGKDREVEQIEVWGVEGAGYEDGYETWVCEVGELDVGPSVLMTPGGRRLTGPRHPRPSNPRSRQCQ